MKWTLLAAGIYALLLIAFAERQVRAGIERLSSVDILRIDGEALLKHPSLQSPNTNPI
jgi:hypothetical protein